jgi:hypothetical protein
MKKDSHFANFYISKLFVYSLLYPEEDNLLYYSLDEYDAACLSVFMNER